MKYALEDLLRVRQFREDTAADLVVKRRAQVANAEQELASRHRELTEFSEWRVRQEESLYDKVINQQVVRKDLDELHAALEELKLEEQARQQKIVDAERTLEAARKALLDSQGAYRTVVKAREKLDEHKALWLQDALKEAEDFQDKELEDFRVKDPDHDEDRDDEPVDSEGDDEAQLATGRLRGRTAGKRSHSGSMK